VPCKAKKKGKDNEQTMNTTTTPKQQPATTRINYTIVQSDQKTKKKTKHESPSSRKSNEDNAYENN